MLSTFWIFLKHLDSQKYDYYNQVDVGLMSMTFSC